MRLLVFLALLLSLDACQSPGRFQGSAQPVEPGGEFTWRSFRCTVAPLRSGLDNMAGAIIARAHIEVDLKLSWEAQNLFKRGAAATSPRSSISAHIG